MSTTHRLGEAEAERRLKEKLSVVRERYARKVTDLREEWSANTLSFGFKAMNVRVAGSLVIEDGAVRLSAQVPFAVVILKRLIEKRIRAELGNLLS